MRSCRVIPFSFCWFVPTVWCPLFYISPSSHFHIVSFFNLYRIPLTHRSYLICKERAPALDWLWFTFFWRKFICFPSDIWADPCIVPSVPWLLWLWPSDSILSLYLWWNLLDRVCEYVISKRRRGNWLRDVCSRIPCICPAVCTMCSA